MRYTSVLSRLWSNWLTLLGSVVATVSGFGIILLLVVGLSSHTSNPYLSLFVVIVLPVAFAVGALLAGLGLQVERRRRQDTPADPVQAAFNAAFDNPSARKRILFVAVATIATVGLFTLGGHKTLAYMSSPKFCGTACHAPMQPQWDTYNRSAHANVDCVRCHIGPSAADEISAKWNGLHQLVGVMTGRYERPITAAHKDLLPASDTCEQCHSPAGYRPNRIKLFAHYAPDKDNTPKFNAMLLHIGGLNPLAKKYEGIHWHADPDNEVRFEILDAARTKVGKVTLLSKGKVVAEYLPAGAPQGAVAVRTMDCLDCHNRSAHMFDYTPKNAVDRALFYNALDAKMPFIAAISTTLLSDTSGPREGAQARLRSALAAAYDREHPDVKPAPEALDKAGTTLAEIYLRNVYPAVKLTWNEHPSNLGHVAEGLENPGCFRCHDNKHEATLADGRKKKLRQECDTCHTGLAFDEDPAKFDDTLASMMPSAN